MTTMTLTFDLTAIDPELAAALVKIVGAGTKPAPTKPVSPAVAKSTKKGAKAVEPEPEDDEDEELEDEDEEDEDEELESDDEAEDEDEDEDEDAEEEEGFYSEAELLAMDLAELKKLAKANDIDITTAKTKAKIIAAFKAAAEEE